jgi:uncharacterized protein (TIGR03084 family)
MLADVLKDLQAESEDLERTVTALPHADWSRPTPATGWTIAHQISHLAWTDAMATLAVTNPALFLRTLQDAADDPAGLADRMANLSLAPPPELLARWRAGRAALAEALRHAPEKEKVIWFGTAMTPAMTATGRLMETWAHGQDVADALGIVREPTDRLRHVAFIGFRTLGNGFVAHGRLAPAEPVRVELTAPDGGTWVYGPENATNTLTGSAVDFCLLVTQRRHPDDLALVASGPVANDWLEVAQAFAGPPGAKRAARS